MTPKTLADYLARKSRLGGTDDRFLWSVGMGVPPAKLDEKARFVGRAILPADSLSAGPTACKAGGFFDPVIAWLQHTDRRQKAIVFPTPAPPHTSPSSPPHP